MERKFSKGEGTTNNSNRFSESGSRMKIHMTTTFLGAASIANMVVSVWAVHRTLKNRHSLTAFASKLRWTLVFVGVAEFFLSLRFLGTGLLGTYVAFVGGLAAGFFLFFPDASYYLGRWILASKRTETPD